MNRGLINGIKQLFVPPALGGGDPANDGALLGFDSTQPGGVKAVPTGTFVTTAAPVSVVNGDTANVYKNETFGHGALSTLTVQNQTAGVGNFTGAYNTAMGYNALHLLQGTAGGAVASANSAFGDQALAVLTTGIQNSGFGALTLASETTGSNNTALGFNALTQQNGASNNTAIGYAAGYNNLTGAQLALVGYFAGTALTTGGANSALGYNSLAACQTGNNNTAIGANALAATTGSKNTAVGGSALTTCSSGIENVAVGANALFSMTTGQDNVAIGFDSGYAPATLTANATLAGQGNLFLGTYTGASSNADPSFGVAIGYSAVVATNGIAIGHNASASASGAIAIGCDHTSTGASSATQDLIVLGTANHTTQIPGLPAFVTGDKYLVVDSTGKIHKSALGPAS